MDLFINTIHQIGIDFTVFYQFIVVLIALPLCIVLLTKPLYEAVSKREQLTSGFKEKADVITQIRKDLEVQYETKMREAQKEAQKKLEASLARSQETTRKLVQEGREESSRTVQSLRKETEQGIQKLKTQLTSEVGGISQLIVEHLG